jgi:uncharacterized protein (TIGR03435 family)
MQPRLLAFAGLLCVYVTTAIAQPALSAAKQFEVATIKPSPEPPANRFGFPVRPSIRFGSNGRLDATQATLFDLIMRAFDTQDFRVVDGPGWIKSARFDVAAQAPAPFEGDAGEMRAMLKALLADRFGLRTHTEARELPVFRLVVADSDGQLGSRLRPSAIDCAAIRRSRGLEEGGEPPCRPLYDMDVRAATMTIRAQGEPMEELARLLTSPETRRVVRDDTGLGGTFDFELSFAPEPLPGFQPLPGAEKGTSLLTALREQLGLRLEADRGPVEVVVIDAAEPPTAN